MANTIRVHSLVGGDHFLMRTLAADITRLKLRAGDLRLMQTYKALDEASQAIGWEIDACSKSQS